MSTVPRLSQDDVVAAGGIRACQDCLPCGVSTAYRRCCSHKHEGQFDAVVPKPCLLRLFCLQHTTRVASQVWQSQLGHSLTRGSQHDECQSTRLKFTTSWTAEAKMTQHAVRNAMSNAVGNAALVGSTC